MMRNPTYTIRGRQLTIQEFREEERKLKENNEELINCIGHPNLALLVNRPYDRKPILLEEGDTAYIMQARVERKYTTVQTRKKQINIHKIEIIN